MITKEDVLAPLPSSERIPFIDFCKQQSDGGYKDLPIGITCGSAASLNAARLKMSNLGCGIEITDASNISAEDSTFADNRFGINSGQSRCPSGLRIRIHRSNFEGHRQFGFCLSSVVP
jgi:hypothetical protein